MRNGVKERDAVDIEEINCESDVMMMIQNGLWNRGKNGSWHWEWLLTGRPAFQGCNLRPINVEGSTNVGNGDCTIWNKIVLDGMNKTGI